MAGQLAKLLGRWYRDRDRLRWVLGSLFLLNSTGQYSAGANLLFNELGQQSGARISTPLGADILEHAERVMREGKSAMLCYDSADLGSIPYYFGLGPEGVVHLLLQPVVPQNNYLGLVELRSLIRKGERVLFLQQILSQFGMPTVDIVPEKDKRYRQLREIMALQNSDMVEQQGQLWLTKEVTPDPHLLIIGRGGDAYSLAKFSTLLGWQVTLCDPRLKFPWEQEVEKSVTVLQCSLQSLPKNRAFNRFDAAVVMTQDAQMDAASITIMQQSSIRYLALPASESYRLRVLNIAGLSSDQLSVPLVSPAGLNGVGGTPQSRVLSVLAECQGVLSAAVVAAK